MMTPAIRCITRSPITRCLPILPCRIRGRRARLARLLSFRQAARVYWTPSPIFLHAEPCERFEPADVVPEIVRHRLVSVRAYGTDYMCIYELGDVCEGTEVERLLDLALVDRRTDYVNIHTARPGCFLCRVERL